MTDPNAFLMGGTVPSATFLAIGASHRGQITEEPFIQQQRDLATGTPMFWPDGNPKNLLVVTIATDERDAAIDNDDGKRRLYVKANMRQAIADAVKKAGAKGLSIGGTLSVTYTGDGVQETRGFNAPKLFSATYTAPTGAAADAFLNGNGSGGSGLAAPAAASAPAQAAAAPAAFTAEQLAAMKAAGMDVSKFVSA